MNQAIKQVEVDERRDATEADITAAVKKLQKVTTEELDGLRKAGAESHAERIETLSQQAEVLASLLPKQLSGEELHKLADESGDSRFMEGVRIIEGAYRPVVSRTYIRAEVRKVDEESGVVRDWEAIPLGMTES